MKLAFALLLRKFEQVKSSGRKDKCYPEWSSELFDNLYYELRDSENELSFS